jgi:hypothetical protein
MKQETVAILSVGLTLFVSYSHTGEHDVSGTENLA